MISKYRKQCTLLSDSLAKAIERVCKQKDEKTVVINDDGQIYDPTDVRRKITKKESNETDKHR